MHLKFPKYIMLQTTSHCNGRCIFCPYPEVKDELPQGNMGGNLYRKIIDECSQYNSSIERIMPYLMNEPLMDEDIVKKINYAKEKNPQSSIHILTNGSLLTEELSMALINSKLDWVGISVHGIYPKTIYDAMGLNPELTLKRIGQFIEMARRSGRNIEEFIIITFLKHKYLTEKEKEETFNFWQEKGIRRISYFEGPISRAGNVSSLPRVRHFSVGGCTTIWANELLPILYNGDAVICCMDWRREVVLGNVKNSSIYEIWNGKRKKAWDMVEGKTESPEDFICKRCEAAIT